MDEISEMIGTGNRWDDACGDNAQPGRRMGPEGLPHAKRETMLRPCEVGRQAIAGLFFWI